MDIAAASMVPPKTMGQRLVRAKTRIRNAGIPFRVPDPEELPERLDAVLDAIYAAYSKGWSDVGDDAIPELADLTPLEADKRMLSYQPYWAAKGHLLSRASDTAPAVEARTIAIGLTTDEALKGYLMKRLASLRAT